MSRLSVFPQTFADLFAQIFAESDQNLRSSALFYLRKSAGNGSEAIYFQPLIRMTQPEKFGMTSYRTTNFRTPAPISLSIRTA